MLSSEWFPQVGEITCELIFGQLQKIDTNIQEYVDLS